MSLTKTQRDKIREWHARGYSVDETSRIMKLPEQLITNILKNPDPPNHNPEFQEPPALNL